MGATLSLARLCYVGQAIENNALHKTRKRRAQVWDQVDILLLLQYNVVRKHNDLCHMHKSDRARIYVIKCYNFITAWIALNIA